MRLFLVVLTITSCTWAADFSLAIGNPVAVAVPNTIVKKDVGIAVRAENCADPSKVEVTATAEGIVNGARRSIAVRVIAGATAGTFAISRDWPREGSWVVHMTGHCGSSTASAVIPIGPNGFLRESSKFFSRAATTAEIESVLKTLIGGAQ